MPMECRQLLEGLAVTQLERGVNVNLHFLAANIDDVSLKVLPDLIHAHTVVNLSSILIHHPGLLTMLA